MFKLFLNTWLKSCFGELFELEAHEVFVPLAFFGFFLQASYFFLCFPVFVKAFFVFGKQLFVVGNDVDDIHLEVFLVKQQVLVLAVYVNQLPAEAFH